MRRPVLRAGAVVLAVLAHLLVVGVAPASAAPPANDEIDGATVVEALPFSEVADTTEATSNDADPQDCSLGGSVWYSYTATATQAIVADTVGSDYDTVLSVYRGPSDGLTLVGCNDDAVGTASQVGFLADAGATYWFVVGGCCGSDAEGGGQLTFSVAELPPPPANDEIEGAVALDELPASATVDATGATAGVDDPTSCYTNGSVWFSLTASTSESIVVRTEADYDAVVSVHAGPPEALTFVAGCAFGGPLLFEATAGTTYYVLVTRCCGDGEPGAGTVTVTLEPAPPPPEAVVSIDAVTVTAVGVPLVSGTIACAPAQEGGTWLTGTIWQRRGDRLVQAQWGVHVDCPEEGATFAVWAHSGITGPFDARRVLVFAETQVCGEFECRTASATAELRATRHVWPPPAALEAPPPGP